jgi:hypothetical protein
MLGYYNRGLYHKAVLYPDSLVGNKYVNASTNYFSARVYALSNEFDKTLEYLEKAVKGGITKPQIEKMYDLDGFRESNMNIVFNLNYDKWHQEYLNKKQEIAIDSVAIKRIRVINNRYNKSLRQRSNNSNPKDSVNFYITNKEVDSLAFIEVINFTIENGFPIKRSIGREYFWYTHILRYNMPENYDADCADWMKVKRMILNEVENGAVFPFYYAAIEDNIKVSRKLPQIYGTIPIAFNGNEDVSDFLLYEIPEELNVRRRSVGLCPIQLELWSKARDLPKSLKGVEFK